MLDTRFSVSISNVPFKVSDEDYAETTFLKLFKIQDEGVDSIQMEFVDSSEIRLKYFMDSLEVNARFRGAFSKKGYFEIYFNSEKEEIPPFVPIIRYYENFSRVRLKLTVDNDFVVDYKWAHRGSFLLIFAGGGGGGTLAYFDCRLIDGK
jgi:hypothetical protein